MLKRLLLLLLLPGCALQAPYPDWMLQEADAYISRIEYLPYEELQATCDVDVQVSGCTRLVTGEIYILDDYAQSFRECVLRHERSHIYDIYVRNLSIPETQEHKHWIEPNCYLPRRVAGRNESVNGG